MNIQLSPSPFPPAAADPDNVMYIPFEDGLCSTRALTPIYRATFPLAWLELIQCCDSINQVINTALPPWLKLMPIAMLLTGFISFAAGGFITTATSGFNGPNPLGLVIVFLGFALFVCGGMGGMVAMTAFGARVHQAVNMKLSELNAAYAERGIEFGIYASQHLEFYRTNVCEPHLHAHADARTVGFPHHHHHGHTGVRTVTKHTLVIQARGTDGRMSIPSPHVLSQQALRPSAPLASEF